MPTRSLPIAASCMVSHSNTSMRGAPVGATRCRTHAAKAQNNTICSRAGMRLSALTASSCRFPSPSSTPTRHPSRPSAYTRCTFGARIVLPCSKSRKSSDLYEAMGHLASGHSISASSHVLRTASMVSSLATRAALAVLYEPSADSIVCSAFSSWAAPFSSAATTDLSSPTSLQAGTACRVIISIMHLSSISTMPAYWSCIASARASVSTLLMTPSESKSAIFLSAVSACVASTPETTFLSPRFSASLGHSAE
mmetsp:Transcript_11143/g.25703  ORF Transcript_11143/g.25703 Transcript_11143/m.25703 type:complete len:253 (+) Transcript_11143:193-951(+)